jgi:hypothetical protein
MDKLKRFLSGRPKWTRIPSETDEDYKLISKASKDGDDLGKENQEFLQRATPMKAKENVLSSLNAKTAAAAAGANKTTKQHSSTKKLVDDEIPLINL